MIEIWKNKNKDKSENNIITTVVSLIDLLTYTCVRQIFKWRDIGLPADQLLA